MTNVAQNVYPKDLTMSLASNYIEREVKRFTKAEDRIFVPDGGAFFSQSLVIKDSAGKLLKPQVDYKLLYLNEGATLESGRDVVSVIWVLSETITSVNLDYRVIGGEFSNTVNAIMQEINKAGPIQKNVDWNVNVYGKPTQFPPAPHFHTPDTFTGWNTIYEQLEGIRKAIIMGDAASWESHYNYISRLMNVLETNINSKFSGYATVSQLNTALSGLDFSVDFTPYYNKTQVNTLVATATKAGTDVRDNLAANYYTKSQSDGRYAKTTDSYSTSVSDSKYALKGESYTKSQSDAKYLISSALGAYYTVSSANALETRINGKITDAFNNIPGVDLSGYYTKTQVYAKGETYAKSQVYSTAETYSKSQVYAKTETYPKTDLYTKTQVYAKGETYSRAETYTKSQVDSAISKIPTTDLSNYYTKSTTYTRTEVQNLINTAINNLPPPDMSDYLTKEDVNALIKSAIGDAVIGIKPVAEIVLSLGTSVTATKAEGFAFSYSNNGWSRYVSTTPPKGGPVSFTITLPPQYDSSKHVIEASRGYNTSGRNLIFYFEYQSRTGYRTESGSGGERFPYTYWIISSTLSIQILNK